MGIIFAERKKKAGLRTSASTAVSKKPTSKYAIPSAPKGKKEAR